MFNRASRLWVEDQGHIAVLSSAFFILKVGVYLSKIIRSRSVVILVVYDNCVFLCNFCRVYRGRTCRHCLVLLIKQGFTFVGFYHGAVYSSMVLGSASS